jgi:hypothetical protein
MSGSSYLPKLMFALAAAIGLVLGLTTYTFPIFGHIQDAVVSSLIHRALHDSATPLPGPPAQLAIETVVPPTSPNGPSLEHAAPPAPAQPAAWAAQAAARDAEALRDWLTDVGFFTGDTEGDTVRTTLWRLTLHRGCPLIIRLRTVSTRETDQLVEISSNCPRVDSAMEPRGTH